MRFGMAEHDITPEPGIFQGGYGFRDHGAEGIRDPLAVVAAVSEHDGRTVLLSSFDLVYVDMEFMKRARGTISRRFGIARNDMIFHATHTHSAPEVRPASATHWNKKNAAYVETLVPALEAAVADAIATMRTCTISSFEDSCDFNVFRRRFVDGQMKMAPNYEVPVDKRVRGLLFTGRKGERLGIIYTYNCHMNVCGDYQISADFAGFSRAAIWRELGCSSLYLQGCCGDVRPRMVNEEGTGFRRGTTDDVRDCGEQLAAAVLRGVKTRKRVSAALDCVGTRISLPLKPAPSTARLRAIVRAKTAEQKWAQLLLKHMRSGKKPYDREPYHIQALKIGQDVVLLFLQGEVVSEYATLLEKYYPDVNLFCHGYSHAPLNYIPTTHILAEGGYEASSYLYSTKPVSGPYRAGLENYIFDAVSRLMNLLLR